MGGLKTISIIVAANIKGLESGLGKANKSLSKFASSSARLGSMMSFGVTAPLAAMGKAAFDTFSQFEDGMTRVRTVTGASVGEIKMLTEEAKRLGATTQFTASQVANLQLVLGRKGFDPTAIKNMEQSILDLALATGEDLNLAAETVSTSINAFQLESGDAARVANTLASAAANSSIQLSTFSTAFGHAGASANAVGVDLEELSAMMGVLMDNGIKASKAGTGLRKIFMKLAKDGTDFTRVLDLATQGEIGLQRAMKLAGVTSANQLLILAKNKKKVAELTEEYKTNTGRLGEMTDLMGKTSKAKIKKMESAIEGLKIEFGALIADAIEPLITWVTDLAREFSALDDSTKDMIISVGFIAGVIGPALLALGALLSLCNPISLGLVAVTGGLVALTGASKNALSPLQKENEALNVLVTRTLAANKGSEKRKELLEDLATQYPDFLSNLDTEKTTNEDLKTALDGANKAYFKKLQLQIREEEVTEALKNQKAAKDKLDKLEITATKKLLGLKDDYNAKLNDEYTATENLITVNDALETSLKLVAGGGMFSGSAGSIEVTKLTNAMGEQVEVSSDLDQELNTLIGLLTDAENEFNLTSNEVDLLKKNLEELTGIAEEVVIIDPSSTQLPEITLTPSAWDNFSEGLQKWSGKLATFAETWGQTFSMMGDISSQFMANRQIENENWYKREKKLIDDSLKSEEEKAEDILALDKDMAIKTAALKKKQAKADKRAAIFNATVNTAVAVTKVIANPILAAIVAGLGAVQVASIAAQPIPAFADGGEPPVGRVSLVGERGPELFVPKSRGTIIPNEALSGFGGGQNVSVQVYGTLDAEGIQIATVQGNEIAKQKGNTVL
tara:strand:+ start:12464 stop:15013 length:2550 start_codon:yes stop_codon:yes gene_type:complete